MSITIIIFRDKIAAAFPYRRNLNLANSCFTARREAAPARKRKPPYMKIHEILCN